MTLRKVITNAELSIECKGVASLDAMYINAAIESKNGTIANGRTRAKNLSLYLLIMVATSSSISVVTKHWRKQQCLHANISETNILPKSCIDANRKYVPCGSVEQNNRARFAAY
jgi:hypothetical protein